MDSHSPDIAGNTLARWREALRDNPRQRLTGIILTIVLELLLVAVLLTLGMRKEEEPPVFSSLTSISIAGPEDSPDDAAEEEADSNAEPVPDTQQPAEQPVASPLPAALPPIPRAYSTPQPPAPPAPVETPAPAPSPSPSRPAIGAVIRRDGAQGPAASLGSNTGGDSEIVGTAPDGQPLYAAAWFREPTDREMRLYLSAVEAPAWALIACKTAPHWAVTDCVGLEQYPTSSNIMNAVLVSASQFQVRPPRRGGRSLVGSWVRIRISYGVGGGGSRR